MLLVQLQPNLSMLKIPDPHFPILFSLTISEIKTVLFIAGIKIQQCNEESCAVSVPYKWLTQNPFHSTYFACLSMAAEMSTGALAMANVYQRKPRASMLITNVESKYFKKGVDKTIFTCNDGLKIKEVVNEAYQTFSPQSITVKSEGYNQNNELIAKFWFTWSFKVKQ